MILFKGGKGRSRRDLSLLDGKDLLYVLFAHLVFEAVVGDCHVEFSHFRLDFKVIINLGLWLAINNGYRWILIIGKMGKEGRRRRKQVWDELGRLDLSFCVEMRGF